MPWSVERLSKFISQCLEFNDGDFVRFFGVVKLLPGEVITILIDECSGRYLPMHVVFCLDIFLLEEDIFYKVGKFRVWM